MQETDIAIIGLGPVGATLANLLGECGVRVVVLEKEAAPYPLPRAVHLDDEVMRVFQSADIADALQKKIRINPGMRFVDANGKLLLDWPRPPERGEHGWHPSYRFHQPDLEHLLREKLADHPSVVTHLNAAATGIQLENEQVVIEWYNYDNTGTATAKNQLRCQYLVGCDGANSLVRQHHNIAWDDMGFNERWLVVDVLLKRERPDLGDVTTQHCDPERPITYVRSPLNRRRWELTLHDNESAGEMTSEDNIWKLLRRWITPDEADIERKAVYTFKSTLANRWYKNRCFLAGDAAHLTPPFMGQGMCCGIRDASNLAWKLAQCVKQGHNEPLINSYQQERYPHMRYYIDTAMTLGSLINAAGTESALNSALLNPDGTARMKSVKPALGSVADQENTPPPIGTLCLQPLIGDKLLDDITGYVHVIIADYSKFKFDFHTAQTDEVVVMDSNTDVALGDLLRHCNTNAIRIRPDRYIAGLATSVDELKALFDL